MTNLSDYFQAQTRVDFYKPAMMKFDGSNDYYNDSYTSSGNLVTAFITFNIASFTGADQNPVGVTEINWYRRIQIRVHASDHATTDQQDRMSVVCVNSANTVICELYSDVDIADGNDHGVFFAFDASNGTAIFKIDGQDADNISATNRVAPTVGTLANSASTQIAVGLGRQQDTSNDYSGAVGFFGYIEAYLTNWDDFFDSLGNPKPLDETTWTEFGSQPEAFNEHADMLDNKGSTGIFTRIGTITVAPAARPV